MSEASGGCLCGAVRFTADDIETHHHACHCSTCRNWTGGPFFGAMVGSIEIEDSGTLQTFDSSDWAERGFCSRCGSSLFYRLKPGNKYIMCVGAFDDSAPFKLSGEIYIDAKPAGYDFAGDHERLTEAETLAKFAPPAD